MKMYKMAVITILFLQILFGFLPTTTKAFTPCIPSPGITCPESNKNKIFFKNTIENIQLPGKYITVIFTNLIKGEYDPNINRAVPSLLINIFLYLGIMILIYDTCKRIFKKKTNNIENGTKT